MASLPIIEFCGLPGAGKSTLEKHLIPLLQKEGVDLIFRDEMVRLYIQNRLCASYSDAYPWRRLITAKYLVGRHLQQCQLRASTGSWQGVLKKVARYSAGWLVEDANLTAIELEGEAACGNLSEGLFQHLAAYLVWNKVSDPMRFLEHFRGCFGKNHTVIRMQVSSQVATSRLLKRGIPSTWDLRVGSPAETVRAFEKYIVFVESFFQDQGNIKIIRIEWEEQDALSQKSRAEILAKSIMSPP